MVNLIAGQEVVPELVANHMTVENVHRHLCSILPDGEAHDAQLAGYELMAGRLGTPGAPCRAAQGMIETLRHMRKDANG